MSSLDSTGLPGNMRAVVVSGPGSVAVNEVLRPVPGPDDVLIRVRACGICGSDAFYIARGGIPPREGNTPLGHEPAGEVVEVGANWPAFPSVPESSSIRWRRAASSATAEPTGRWQTTC